MQSPDISVALHGEVSRFRSRVAVGQYEEIVLNASSGFRKSVTKEEFVVALKSVADEIGDKSRFQIEEEGHSWSPQSSERFVLIFAAKPNGKVVKDEFVFILENGRYMLDNYRIEY